MEGQALVWFRDLKESGSLGTWAGFTQALLTRFGHRSYDDLVEALIKLKQSGLVEEHKFKFEAFSNRLRELSESYKLSYFLSGLRDDIRLPIRMFKLDSLLTAYSLAKIQEHVGVTKRSYKGSLPLSDQVASKQPLTNHTTTPKGPSKALVLVQKINQSQMKDKETKGSVTIVIPSGILATNVLNSQLFLIKEVDDCSCDQNA